MQSFVPQPQPQTGGHALSLAPDLEALRGVEACVRFTAVLHRDRDDIYAVDGYLSLYRVMHQHAPRGEE